MEHGEEILDLELMDRINLHDSTAVCALRGLPRILPAALSAVLPLLGSLDRCLRCPLWVRSRHPSSSKQCPLLAQSGHCLDLAKGLSGPFFRSANANRSSQTYRTSTRCPEHLWNLGPRH